VGAELFLRWREDEVGAVVDTLLDTFASLGLLTPDAERRVWHRPVSTSVEAMRLSILSAAMIPTIERYYLVIAVLLQARSGAMQQEALEQRCHLMAQRMSLLYGLNSPEFFDKSLFRNFIDLMRVRRVVENGAEGKLEFGELLLAVAGDAQLVLSEQIRHSILQVTLG